MNSKNRSLNTAVRWTMLLAIITAVFLIALSITSATGKAFAQDEPPIGEEPEYVLTILKDGEEITKFTQADLEQLAAEEGDITYTFSGWNRNPSYRKEPNAHGPTVDAVLKAAGVRDDVTDEGTVLFNGTGYKVSLTGYQLFGEERFFYPKGNLVKPLEGLIPEESYEDAVLVPAIIYLTGGEDENVLYIGQVAPNEENRPAFAKYLSAIEVITSKAPKCTVAESIPASGSDCSPGQEITLKRARNNIEYIYYTMDPDKTPDHGFPIYNSADNSGLITPPVLPDTYGPVILKTIVKGYGKLDSDVTTFTFTVRPQTPASLNASAASFNSVRLTWKKSSDAGEYRIYRAEGKGTMKLIKTVGSGVTSLTDTGLKTGTAYSYQIAAAAKGGDGSMVESRKTAKVSAKPVLSKPVVKLKAGKRKAAVKWTKIAGANGYEIYRSAKKSSGFRKIKTIKNGNTKSYTDKKLKKGKKYYYRIRAYRTVDGRKVYSSYSAVKKTKVK